MLALLLDNPLWIAFAFASLVLALTPGPGVLFIVSRTLTQGRKAGLITVAGVALGNLGNALGAGLGLSALFSVSATAFAVVKFVGAGYLFYLGWQTLNKPSTSESVQSVLKSRTWSLFREGFWVALLNPKTMLFFAAFLPQFMTTTASPFLQSLAFGVSFVCIAAITDSIYVLAAAGLRKTLNRVGWGLRYGRYAQGAVYIGLGLFAAFSGQRTRVSPTL